MLNKIIHFSLHNRILVLVASVLLLVGGFYTAYHTEMDVFPDLTAPTVVVMTEANGMAAEEVEQLVTFPIEALTEEQGLYFIYIQKCEESYRKQEVKLGASNGKEVQILSGIQPGDKVVVKGAYHVKLASASNALPAHSHEH